LRRMNTPAVILEGASCKSLYSGRRIFCPRSIHHWWREIWLERVAIEPRPQATPSSHQAGSCATTEHCNST
jgi:hypothetical protein